jgi:hypothetical protein
MMDDTHVADGIAVTLLLAGLVLASAAVGASGLGLVAAQSDAGDIDARLDGADAPRLAFPINNISVGGPAAPRLAFPVDDGSLAGSSGADLASPAFRSQDMDPYVLPQDMDPY